MSLYKFGSTVFIPWLPWHRGTATAKTKLYQAIIYIFHSRIITATQQWAIEVAHNYQVFYELSFDLLECSSI